MARPNRNNQENSEMIVRIENSTYRAAGYARLSVEDNGCCSDSIENQIYMIEKFIQETPELSLVSTYFDNGRTGTNFERPDFIAMFDAVKKGKINCIVVKDLSRFGRNYMETGNYLEGIFPLLGIRFISINDHYDSLNAGANEMLTLSLKNVYHHTYAKDISHKIGAILDVKKKNALFLGRFAPYGYQKSDSNRYQLVIEEETAVIVHEIFKLRMDGLGIAAIAKRLNDRGVKSQYRRLYDMGAVKGKKGEATAAWSGSSVLGVLENPNYYGCTVERKSDSAYYKGIKKCILPKSEWTYIENTHEAIIEKSTFEAVQKLIAESKKNISSKRMRNQNCQRTENILRGLVTCGKCKRKMLRDNGYYDAQGILIRHRYGCPQKYQNNVGCTTGSIIEDDLLTLVFSMLRIQILLLTDPQDMLKDYFVSSECQMERNVLENEIAAIKRKFTQIELKKEKLYRDYKETLISESEYTLTQKKCESEQLEYKNKLEELKERHTKIQEKIKSETKWIYNGMDFYNEICLRRELCIKLLASIEVFASHVIVKYTFSWICEKQINASKIKADSSL